jgi:hypothetical protein
MLPTTLALKTIAVGAPMEEELALQHARRMAAARDLMFKRQEANADAGAALSGLQTKAYQLQITQEQLRKMEVSSRTISSSFREVERRNMELEEAAEKASDRQRVVLAEDDELAKSRLLQVKATVYVGVGRS